MESRTLGRNGPQVSALGLGCMAMSRTPSQLATAWALAQGTDIIPLLGARNRQQLEDSLGALDVRLKADEIREIKKKRFPTT